MLPAARGQQAICCLRFDPGLRAHHATSACFTRTDAEAIRPCNAESELKSLRRLAEDRIKNDLEAVEGTAAVKVSGGLEDEIQIQVDQQKLSQLGIGIEAGC